MPARSTPRTSGNRVGPIGCNAPSAIIRSIGLIPAAPTLINTCPGPGCGSSTSMSAGTAPYSFTAIARIMPSCLGPTRHGGLETSTGASRQPHQVDPGERAPRLLHASSGREITEIDREEPGALEQVRDYRLGGTVVPGQEQHTAAAGLMRIAPKEPGTKRVGGLHDPCTFDELRHDLTR